MRNFWVKLWRLTQPYWVSPDKYRAWALLAGLLLLGFLVVRVQVSANTLTRQFYDALQNYQPQLALHMALRYLALVGIFAVFSALASYLGNTLINRWRRWLTQDHLDRWLKHQAFYRMPLCGQMVDNPDQRISEDIEQFASITLSLFNGFYANLIQLVTFLLVLWQLSGALRFSVGHWHVAISGYLVWGALIYAGFSTLVTVIIGRSLSHLTYQQQHYNADFRFGLMRVREHAEAIAMMHGERHHQQQLAQSYGPIYRNFAKLIMVGSQLTLFTKASDYLSMMVGILFALPKFMLEKMSVGDLMQISSAFGYVVSGFSFFMNAYADIANWRAVIHRLDEFSRKIACTDHYPHAGVIKVNHGKALVLRDVQILTPQGQGLLAGLNHTISQGERVLIMGPVGMGKSTLLRCVAGVWPFMTGCIEKPLGSMVFLTQKPYLPALSLREALCFPALPDTIDTDTFEQALQAVRLPAYTAKLAQVEQWLHTLSLGEQQLLSVARAIILKPQWLFLDEATSSLDEANEAHVYQQLRVLLPQTTIVSIGHRSTLKQWHERVIDLA